MNKLIDNKSIDSMRSIINCAVIFSLFLIVLFTCPVGAATYYVKNGGNDSLSGLSDSTAWASIAKVSATVGSGDTVYFRSQDTWSSSSSPVLQAATGVTYRGTGYGSGARATIQATGTQSYGTVYLNVSNVNFYGFNVDMNSQNAGGIWIGTTSGNIQNINVDNCEVHGSAGSGYAYGIYVGGYGTSTDVSNVQITNTLVHHTQHEGIAIYPTWGRDGNSATNVTVRNCIIHDTGVTGGVTWGDGIYIVNELDDIYIEFNTIYDCPVGMRYGNSSDAYVGDPHNINIRYNIVYNCTYGIGMNFGSGGHNSSANVYGNLLYENQYGFNIGGTHSGSTFNYYNNTVYDNTHVDSNGVRNYLAGMTNSTLNFKNNIIVVNHADSYPIWIGTSGAEVLWTHANNLIYKSSSTTKWVHHDTVADYSNLQTKSTWDATAVITNPAFSGGTLPTGFSGTYGSNMVPNTDYFQLTVDSPAKDTGATLEGYTGSINGAGLTTPIVRPLGAAFDIGAYEYGTVAQSGGSAGSGFKIQGVTIR
jgi:hypothetical protein